MTLHSFFLGSQSGLSFHISYCAILLLFVISDTASFVSVLVSETLEAVTLQVDPEAAKVVFESGLQIVMVPLEVTHTALATASIIRSITTENPTPFLLLVKEIILYFSDTYKTVFSFTDPPIHDPCALYYVAQPQQFQASFHLSIYTCLHHRISLLHVTLTQLSHAHIILLTLKMLKLYLEQVNNSVKSINSLLLVQQVEKMRVDIETVSPLTAGQTVCDIYHMSHLPKNVAVAKVRMHCHT